MKHRGKIQAQGEKLEKSESWVQEKPPTKTDGLNMLQKLMNKLSKKDQKIREKASKNAAKWIENAAKTNGIDAPANVTFRAEGYVKERIDIEVKKGKAFIENKDKEG
ncbi:MAG: hypothetical protein CSA05_00050 [Bacteroidia bacterium]|nr:MAG: hypothetical protein CSB01_00925 [Bacteroidia bacterium]PIE86519.1 MAG: hypothetical protein CSA05_00050 [Bacteroidia bacterium]